jgi:hypothetical protein
VPTLDLTDLGARTLLVVLEEYHADNQRIDLAERAEFDTVLATLRSQVAERLGTADGYYFINGANGNGNARTVLFCPAGFEVEIDNDGSGVERQGWTRPYADPAIPYIELQFVPLTDITETTEAEARIADPTLFEYLDRYNNGDESVWHGIDSPDPDEVNA